LVNDSAPLYNQFATNPCYNRLGVSCFLSIMKTLALRVDMTIDKNFTTALHHK
jgi:hypothetical protein